MPEKMVEKLEKLENKFPSRFFD